MSSSVLSLGEVSIYAHTFPLWSAKPVPGGDLKRHGKTAIFSSQDTVHPVLHWTGRDLHGQSGNTSNLVNEFYCNLKMRRWYKK